MRVPVKDPREGRASPPETGAIVRCNGGSLCQA